MVFLGVGGSKIELSNIAGPSEMSTTIDYTIVGLKRHGRHAETREQRPRRRRSPPRGPHGLVEISARGGEMVPAASR